MSVIGDLSEAEVLRSIVGRFPVGTHTIHGPGDDAAVLDTADAATVVSTDTMVEGVDFHTAWSDPEDVGFKLVACNLADVAAMGAEPMALVVSLAAPTNTELKWVERFADGMCAAIAELAPDVGLVGGDLSSSPVLVLTGTSLGRVVTAGPVLRSGARPGDVVAYAGTLGRSACGLQLLQQEAVDQNGRPNRDLAARVRLAHPIEVSGHVRPQPPIGAGVVAARAGASAMLDVSDGLAKDAERIALASNVGIEFDPEGFAADWRLEVYGGEEHGLLATFPPDVAIPTEFRVIGQVNSESGVLRFAGNVLPVTGWETFQR